MKPQYNFIYMQLTIFIIIIETLHYISTNFIMNILYYAYHWIKDSTIMP